MRDRKKLISRALLLVMGITFVFGQLCGNCLSQCNEETGECSGKCALGWDGPTCSRRNVAFNQSTTQSSDYSEGGFSFTSGLAVDGRTGHQLYTTPYTCTHTHRDPHPAFWTVTLDAQYNIYRFRIYNRNDYSCAGQCGQRLNGFSLSVGNSSQSYKICYQDNTTAEEGPGDIINALCNVSGPVFGDTVNISIYKPLSLCEIQIFVCALGTYGPDCGRRCGNCAQGPSVCNTTSGHCPQRTPRCMKGYSGLKCDTVCTSGTYGPDCKKRCGNCTAGSLVCNTTSGHCPQTLPICIPGFSPPTCETNCNPGTYGSDCKRKCGHCSEGESVCDVTIGHCPDRKPRCSPGYSGVACDTECRNNTWGKDCQETCGNCYDKTECNAVTGECPVATGNPRCDLGYTGTDCVKVSDLTDTSKDYTGVIAGSAVGISLVVLVTGLIIIVMVRRITTRVQTGGAKGSGPNSTPAEESSVPAEVMNRSEMSEPASLYNTRDKNSGEDPPYEAIREYVNL